MSHEYHAPGDYIAICRNDGSDHAFAYAFTLPDTVQEFSAKEYFERFVDANNTVEAVYPATVFVQMRFAARKPEELYAKLREEDGILAFVTDQLLARRSFIVPDARAVEAYDKAMLRFGLMRDAIRRQMRQEGLCG